MLQAPRALAQRTLSSSCCSSIKMIRCSPPSQCAPSSSTTWALESGVHTAAQLVVGALIGVGSGAAWFGLEAALRGPVLAPLQRRLDRVWAWLDIRFDDCCGGDNGKDNR
mmetsp:Transcript_104922/g.266469  ORF Transcript_104922/g.266469 Transcript_104922/m.266469 type:complete len:110 (-) Transcript_104922:36-365(-)